MLKRRFGPGNISIVYIYAIAIVVFTLWIPHLWWSVANFKNTLNVNFAIPALLACGLVVPLLGGLYDLSIGGTMDVSAIMVSWLLVNEHWGVVPAIAIAFGLSLVIGAINGLLVVVVGIDSFIATLASSSILSAFAVWRSGDIQITGLPKSFSTIGQGSAVGGIIWPVVYALIVALVLWYVIEHTPVGRLLQASGDSKAAAKLAGVRTERYQFGSLVVSAGIAGIAGVVETAIIGAGNADVGSPFLLAAFAAAFLGSTQFKGRFNIAGVIASVWALASLVQGITLAVGSFSWLNSLFFGLALIVAVGGSVGMVKFRSYRTVRSLRSSARVELGLREQSKV